ncbi:hypothetical protein Aduo_016840 [Ancylostoma duodenale]
MGSFRYAVRPPEVNRSDVLHLFGAIRDLMMPSSVPKSCEFAEAADRRQPTPSRQRHPALDMDSRKCPGWFLT